MKKNPIHPDGFFDDFFDWLDSKDGQTSMQANDDVADALEGAELDVGNRKIIWKDGSRLTIEQTAKRIYEMTGTDLPAITSHVIGWLEMDYIPQGLNEKQMEVFEAEIENWIREHETGENNSR
jgi:hypothetical protein